MTVDANRLPRLLYIGNVDVVDTYAGALLLHRLLSGYPPGKLCCCSQNPRNVPDKSRLLPGVEYHPFPLGWVRLETTRLAGLHALFLHFRGRLPLPRLEAVRRRFAPEAILTIGHTENWIAADALSRRHGLPLHMIVHDDGFAFRHLPRQFAKWGEARFARVYRRAASRMCVSSVMAEEYLVRYGAPARVVYPCRAQACLAFDAPPPQARDAGRPLRFFYTGSINSQGVFAAIEKLGDIVAARGHTLECHVMNADRETGARLARRSGIVVHDPVPPGQLLERLREAADVLFLPVDFEGANGRLLFPTKMSDYSAVGLPVIAWAHPESAVARFARENPGSVVLVTEPSGDGLDAAVRQVEDPARRVQFGSALLDAGNRHLSHAAAWRTITAALLSRPAEN